MAADTRTEHEILERLRAVLPRFLDDLQLGFAAGFPHLNGPEFARFVLSPLLKKIYLRLGDEASLRYIARETGSTPGSIAQRSLAQRLRLDELQGEKQHREDIERAAWLLKEWLQRRCQIFPEITAQWPMSDAGREAFAALFDTRRTTIHVLDPNVSERPFDLESRINACVNVEETTRSLWDQTAYAVIHHREGDSTVIDQQLLDAVFFRGKDGGGTGWFLAETELRWQDLENRSAMYLYRVHNGKTTCASVLNLGVQRADRAWYSRFSVGLELPGIPGIDKNGVEDADVIATRDAHERTILSPTLTVPRYAYGVARVSSPPICRGRIRKKFDGLRRSIITDPKITPAQLDTPMRELFLGVLRVNAKPLRLRP